MRVLALVHKYPPVHNAGAELMLHAILRDLAARGHECAVTYPGAEPSDLDGIPIVPTPPHDNGLAPAAGAADILITHLDVTRRAMRVAERVDRPLVHLVHNDAQLAHHHVARAALVVFNSQWIAHANRHYEGASIVVRPPVWPDEYRTSAVDQRDITLINLTTAKGGGLLVELARDLPDRTFLGVKGAYGTQAIPRRLPRNLEVIEHTSDVVDDVYARTRVLLVPSTYESWGRVAIEAASSGIPVVANQTPGLLEALGPAGIFPARLTTRHWARALGMLDDAGVYRKASSRLVARALELEDQSRRELDAFAVTLERIVGAYAPPNADERTLVSILSSERTGGKRCPICGAAKCACGGQTDGHTGTTVFGGLTKGQPLTVYRTAAGDFRLSEDDAKRRGLIPAGALVVAPIRRRLDNAGFNVRTHVAAYEGASDAARAEYLERLAATNQRSLPSLDDELLALLNAHKAPESPPAPTKTAPRADDPPIRGRAGEMLEWAGDDKARITEAIEAETGAKNRPTLIQELERRLEADDT